MGTIIKLSIVIPTLNSEDVLSDTLAVLLPQTCNQDSVEVIVINNGSTDKTQNVIDSYKSQYSSLKFIKRSSTIPAGQNFKDGVHQSNGEYVLLLGDDDVVSPSFIQSVLPLLDGDYGLIHYNRVLGLNNLADNSQVFRNIDIRGIICYESYIDFLKEYTYEFNFMSSVIFKKEVWIRGEEYVSFEKPYYGYHWYASLVFGSIGYSCLYYSYPLIIQRERNKTWKNEWPLYWIVGMFSIYKDLDSFLPEIYSDFYRKQHDNEKDHFISLFSIIANSKDLYKSHKDEFASILTKREMALFNLVLYTPSFLGLICQKTYRLLKL